MSFVGAIEEVKETICHNETTTSSAVLPLTVFELGHALPTDEGWEGAGQSMMRPSLGGALVQHQCGHLEVLSVVDALDHLST